MSSDEELEELRRKRILELQRQLSSEQQQVDQQRTINAQKENVLRQILTPDARQRMNRIKLVKPEFIERLELQLILIAQSGRVQLPINDKQLKQMLQQLQPSRGKITFRRI
ncbi:MAG: DNA-binding protein [Candidatus Bathyarchaeota archaeon]|nr:MAG: DNA-binding protein [Candidatus Bathyarchaeota archaeon]